MSPSHTADGEVPIHSCCHATLNTHWTIFSMKIDISQISESSSILLTLTLRSFRLPMGLGLPSGPRPDRCSTSLGR